MKFELNSEILYLIKDAMMVEFLKDDLNLIKQNLIENAYPDEIKYDKKLVKAYKLILKYYGEDNG